MALDALVLALLALFFLDVHVLLLAVRACHRLPVVRRLGVATHPRALEVVLLVDDLVVGGQEQVVHHEEVQVRAVDVQLVRAVDARDKALLVGCQVVGVATGVGGEHAHFLFSARLGNEAFPC